jgi:hypothetical protein
MLNSLVRSPTDITILVKSESGAHTEFQATFLSLIKKIALTIWKRWMAKQKFIKLCLPIILMEY